MRGRILLTIALAVSISTASACEASNSLDSHALLNVELNSASSFVGQILGKTGVAIGNTPVVIQCGQVLTKTATNKTGHFQVKLATGGVCRVDADECTHFFRVWKHGTAPPKSIASIALVQNEASIIRGNMFKRRNCPDNCQCEECGRSRSGRLKGSVALLGLGGVAAYFALSRENASE